MAQMKAMIREKVPPSSVFEYSPQYREAKLCNLESFAVKFEADVWQAIEKAHPTNAGMKSPLQLERSYHEEFIEMRGHNFVGRRSVLTQMEDYCRDDESTTPLAVVGAPGAGKSALLAHFVRWFSASYRDTYIVVHFIGGSPTSTDVVSMLRHLCGEISAYYALHVPIPSDYTELESTLRHLLERAAGEHDRLLLVIDALNQLDDGRRLTWLPKILPRTVKVVVSCLPGICLDVLRSRRVPEIPVPALTANDQAEIANQILADFSKKLDHVQMRLLLAKKESNSPLYLVTACEELRVFGDFGRVNEKISKFADTVPELLDQVLARLEHEAGDNGGGAVRRALSLLRCSRHGLFIADIIQCLGVTPAAWSYVFLSLKTLLRAVGAKNEGRVDFFHQQLAKAVTRRYLSSEADRKATHTLLADHFLRQSATAAVEDGGKPAWSAAFPAAVSELPYHLAQACRWDDFCRVLCDLGFIQTKCELHMAAKLLEDYALAPPGHVTADLKAFKEFVMTNLSALQAHPHTTAQQAAALPANSSPVRVAGAAALSASGSGVPYVTWDNRRVLGQSRYRGNMAAASEVAHIDFAPDSSQLAAAYRDGSVKLWDTSTCAELATLSVGNGHATWCRYATGRHLLATYESGVSLVWDVKTSNVAHTLLSEKEEPALCCAVFAYSSGVVVAVGYEDGLVSIFHVDSLGAGQDKVRPSTTFQAHDTVVKCVAYSSSGSLLATVSNDKVAKLWSCDQGNVLDTESCFQTLRHHVRSLSACVFLSGSDDLITAAMDRFAVHWSVSGSPDILFEGHTQNVSACAVSPDDKYVVTGSFDKSVKLWETATGTNIATLEGHSHFITAVAFSPDSRFIATGSLDMSTRLYDVCDALSGQQEGRSNEHGAMVKAVQYCRASGLVATGSWDRTAKLFATDGREVASFASHPKRVNAVALTPEVLVTASSDNTLKVWDLKLKEDVLTLTGHTQPVFACCLSHNGLYLASGSVDTTARIWLLETGEEVGVLSGHKDWIATLDFSPSDRLLCTGSKDTLVKVWNSQTGEEVTTLVGNTNGLLAVKFSPDESLIASGGEDCVLRVWGAGGSFPLVRQFKGHTHEITAVCFFANNSNLVATSSSDKTVRVWDIYAGGEVVVFYTALSLLSMEPLNVPAYDPGQWRVPVVAGDSAGNLHWLTIHNLKHTPVLQFSRLLLVVGKIIACKRIPHADKLYVEEVDVGEERLQIVSGLVQHVPLDQMLNRLVVVTRNIREVTLQGTRSMGKLVGIEAADGSVELLCPPTSARPGTRVGLRGCLMAPPEQQLPLADVCAIYEEMAVDLCGTVQFAGVSLVCAGELVRVGKLVGGRGC
eukprot:TRINITY_DN1663_c0_g1_i1.p1 TRINITY_DN1663_c0_g1~~TRINITY_DN1663_c0_g1_i1.p1  ORF type:complete len:1342 (-),score=293.54 TRINITY_DN1663_c0_g1_i1:57-4082(-)